MAYWQGVEEFVAVVESQSFTGAAKKLNTSVVHVSRKIAKLEQHLAIKLLNRTTRKISVTEAGSLYYEKCRHLVEGLDIAEQAVTNMQTTLTGQLKLTAPFTYGEKFIAPLVNEFIEQNPQINVELVLTNQQLDLVDNNIDVAIRLGVLKDSTLIAKKLGTRQLHVCASPQYLDEFGIPASIDELSGHQCLIGSIGFWKFQQLGVEKNYKVAGRLACNSGPSLLDAAKRGLGLVQLPDYYVREPLKRQQLKEVLTDFSSEPEGIWAVFSQNKYLSTKTRLFIDFLAQRLPEIT